jgi:hypothetical protein
MLIYSRYCIKDGKGSFIRAPGISASKFFRLLTKVEERWRPPEHIPPLPRSVT